MTSRHTIYQVLISSCIALLLASQFARSVGLVEATGFSQDRMLWPILSYHMFSRARFDGDTVEAHDLLQGVRMDDSVVDIPMEALNLNLWNFRDLLADLKAGDPRAVDMIVGRYSYARELKELRVLSFPVMVTRNGPAEKPSELLATIPLIHPATD